MNPLYKYSAFPLWPVVFTLMMIEKIINLRRNRYIFRIAATLAISIVFYLGAIYFGTATAIIYLLINLSLTVVWCRAASINGKFERLNSTIEAMQIAGILACAGTILVATVLVSETEMCIYDKNNEVPAT